MFRFVINDVAICFDVNFTDIIAIRYTAVCRCRVGDVDFSSKTRSYKRSLSFNRGALHSDAAGRAENSTLWNWFVVWLNNRC